MSCLVFVWRQSTLSKARVVDTSRIESSLPLNILHQTERDKAQSIVRKSVAIKSNRTCRAIPFRDDVLDERDRVVNQKDGTTIRHVDMMQVDRVKEVRLVSTRCLRLCRQSQTRCDECELLHRNVIRKRNGNQAKVQELRRENASIKRSRNLLSETTVPTKRAISIARFGPPTGRGHQEQHRQSRRLLLFESHSTLCQQGAASSDWCFVERRDGALGCGVSLSQRFVMSEMAARH
jgi:hypothetical protein